MFQVQEAVHGVTLEECQAALQNHSWNVQKAVNYLKVRHTHTHPPVPRLAHKVKAKQSHTDLSWNSRLSPPPAPHQDLAATTPAPPGVIVISEAGVT